MEAMTASATPRPARYWLMKSEPEECSIDDALAAPQATVPWTGVRNYQARNFMRDAMRVGDGVLFYHSSCAEPGVAGIAQVASAAYPDATQFDPSSPYFDPKAKADAPRWVHVDVKLVRKTRLLSLRDDLLALGFVEELVEQARQFLAAEHLARRGRRSHGAEPA